MITGHVFRLGMICKTVTGAGSNRGQAVMPGMCAFNGTCNQPRSVHIRVKEFRATRRGAR